MDASHFHMYCYGLELLYETFDTNKKIAIHHFSD